MQPVSKQLLKSILIFSQAKHPGIKSFQKIPSFKRWCWTKYPGLSAAGATWKGVLWFSLYFISLFGYCSYNMELTVAGHITMKQTKVKHSETREETHSLWWQLYFFPRLACKFKLSEENLKQLGWTRLWQEIPFNLKQFCDSELFRNSVGPFLFWLWSKHTGTKVTQLMPAF